MQEVAKRFGGNHQWTRHEEEEIMGSSRMEVTDNPLPVDEEARQGPGTLTALKPPALQRKEAVGTRSRLSPLC